MIGRSVCFSDLGVIHSVFFDLEKILSNSYDKEHRQFQEEMVQKPYFRFTYSPVELRILEEYRGSTETADCKDKTSNILLEPICKKLCIGYRPTYKEDIHEIETYMIQSIYSGRTMIEVEINTAFSKH